MATESVTEPCNVALMAVKNTDRHAAQIAVLMDAVTQAKALGVQNAKAIKAMLEGQGAGEEQPAGQPDWIGCTDAAEAERIIVAVDEWLDRYGRTLKFDVHPCWPWHPHAVVLLLAGMQQHAEAYKAKAADKVADLHIRVLPGMRAQIGRSGANGCHRSAHREIEDGPEYAVHLDQIPELATWWATSREGLPPGLSRRMTAAS